MDAERPFEAVVAVAVGPGIYLRLLREPGGWRFLSWTYATGQEAAPSPPPRDVRRVFTTKAEAVQYFQTLWPSSANLGRAISAADRQRMAPAFACMKAELESLERQVVALGRTDLVAGLAEGEPVQRLQDRIAYLIKVVGRQS